MHVDDAAGSKVLAKLAAESKVLEKVATESKVLAELANLNESADDGGVRRDTFGRDVKDIPLLAAHTPVLMRPPEPAYIPGRSPRLPEGVVLEQDMTDDEASVSPPKSRVDEAGMISDY